MEENTMKQETGNSFFGHLDNFKDGADDVAAKTFLVSLSLVFLGAVTLGIPGLPLGLYTAASAFTGAVGGAAVATGLIECAVIGASDALIKANEDVSSDTAKNVRRLGAAAAMLTVLGSSVGGAFLFHDAAVQDIQQREIETISFQAQPSSQKIVYKAANGQERKLAEAFGHSMKGDEAGGSAIIQASLQGYDVQQTPLSTPVARLVV